MQSSIEDMTYHIIGLRGVGERHGQPGDEYFKRLRNYDSLHTPVAFSGDAVSEVGGVLPRVKRGLIAQTCQRHNDATS